MPLKKLTNLTGTTRYTLRLDTGPAVGFINDPTYFNIDDSTNGIVSQLNLFDNAFDMFPYYSMYVGDDGGIFSREYPFIEGLNQRIALGECKTTNFLQHDFYWYGQQLPQGKLLDYVAGTNLWSGISRYRIIDAVKSSSFGINSAYSKGIPLATVINQVAGDYFPKANLFIDPQIKNVDLFYQANQYDFEFLKSLSKIAASSNGSPYLCFINLQDEFYFDTVYNLMSKEVIPSLKFKIDSNTITQQFDDDQLRHYNALSVGGIVNEKNYEKNVFSVDRIGSVKINDVFLKQFFNPPQVRGNDFGTSGAAKILIRNQNSAGLKDVRHFGIVDTDSQKYNKEGWINNLFLDSMLGYRMNISVPFNADAVSGRNVEILFKNTRDSKLYNKLYSGKWLIWQSNHHWLSDKRRAFTHLNLVKTGLELNDKSPPADFKTDF